MGRQLGTGHCAPGPKRPGRRVAGGATPLLAAAARRKAVIESAFVAMEEADRKWLTHLFDSFGSTPAKVDVLKTRMAERTRIARESRGASQRPRP